MKPELNDGEVMALKASVTFKVDDTGVGGGVTDEMMRRGWIVVAINFGAKATDPDKYPNLISEAWFYLASILDQIQLNMDAEVFFPYRLYLDGDLLVSLACIKKDAYLRETLPSRITGLCQEPSRPGGIISQSFRRPVVRH